MLICVNFILNGIISSLGPFFVCQSLNQLCRSLPVLLIVKENFRGNFKRIKFTAPGKRLNFSQLVCGELNPPTNEIPIKITDANRKFFFLF